MLARIASGFCGIRFTYFREVKAFERRRSTPRRATTSASSTATALSVMVTRPHRINHGDLPTAAPLQRSGSYAPQACATTAAPRTEVSYLETAMNGLLFTQHARHTRGTAHEHWPGSGSGRRVLVQLVVAPCSCSWFIAPSRCCSPGPAVAAERHRDRHYLLLAAPTAVLARN